MHREATASEQLISSTDMAAIRAARFAAGHIHTSQMDAASSLQRATILVAIQRVSTHVVYKLLLEMITITSTDSTRTARLTCWVEVEDCEWKKDERYCLKYVTHLQKDNPEIVYTALQAPDVKLVVDAASHQIIARPEGLVSHGTHTEPRKLCDALVQCLKGAVEGGPAIMKPLWVKKRGAGGTIFEVLMQIDDSHARKCLHRYKTNIRRPPFVKCKMFLPVNLDFDSLRLLTVDVVEESLEFQAVECELQDAIQKSGGINAMARHIHSYMETTTRNKHGASASLSAEESLMEVIALTRRVDDLKEEEQQLKGQCTTAIQQRHLLHQKAKGLVAHVEALEVEVKELTTQKKAAETQLQLMEAQLAQSRHNGVTGDDALSKAVDGLKEEEKQLKVQCETAIKQRDALHQKTKGLVAHVEKLDVEAEELQKTVDGLKEEEKRLKAQCVAAIEQRDALHKKTKGLVAHVEELDDEVEQLLKAKKEAQEELHKTRTIHSSEPTKDAEEGLLPRHSWSWDLLLRNLTGFVQELNMEHQDRVQKGADPHKSLHNVFYLIDEDDSNEISKEEFFDAMQTIGVKMDSAGLGHLFDCFDKNGDGTISKTEVVVLFRSTALNIVC